MDHFPGMARQVSMSDVPHWSMSDETNGDGKEFEELHGGRPVDLDGCDIPPHIASCVPEILARKHRVVPMTDSDAPGGDSRPLRC